MCCRKYQQCTQLKLTPAPVSPRNKKYHLSSHFRENAILYMYRFNFSPQYGGTSEKLRENIFSRKCCWTKNLPPYFPISLVRNQIPLKKKKSVFRPSKKKSTVDLHRSAHSPGQPLFQALRGILESFIAEFSRKHHTCTDFHFSLSMGVLARNYEFAKMLL